MRGTQLDSHGRDDVTRVGYLLRRFYLRNLIAILVPAAIAAYFIAIWLLYIDERDQQGPLKHGRPGALTVFYSWFVIGTIGLNLAEYGLAGVEASMLMEPRWRPRNALQVMMHSEGSWSGPGGWLAVAKKTFYLWRRPSPPDRPTQWPSKLWVTLASLSALSYIALPLSGLCMELSDGFIYSNQRSSRILLAGRNYSNFEARIDDDMIRRATERWRSASGPFLPMLGVAYAPETSDRSQPGWTFLDSLPNTLPVDSGVRDVFLGPQADVPISGRVWGVVVRYNCSAMSRLSDSTILKHRDRSRPDITNVGGTTNTFIMGRNQSFGGQVYNVQAYWEVGTSSIEGGAQASSWFNRYHDPGGPFSGLLTNYTPPGYDEHMGLKGEEVLEVALWQAIDPDPDTPPVVSFTPNRTLEFTIPELGREIESFTGKNKSLGFMPAIGARCTSNSAVGYADVDGRHFTFRDFRPQTTRPSGNGSDNTAAVRFSPAISHIIMQKSYSDEPPAEWLYSLFTSSQSVDLIATGQSREWMATGLLQPSGLRRALLQAHASYALQLEYDGRYDSHGAYTDPGVAALEPGKVLTSGVIPPVVVAVLLLAWAFFSTVLACWYGFRRRWSQVLDGYSMFRFGADYADFVCSRPDFGSAVDFEHCDALREIPGMVGNLAPSWTPGHIGLVDGVYAPKNALYA